MNYEEFEKYVCDQYRDIFKNNYNEDYAKESVKKIWDSVDNKEDALKAAQAIIDRTRARVEASNKNFDNLSILKEGLHDAPTDVKEAFNTVAEYFDMEYFGVVSNMVAGVKGAMRGIKDDYRISKLQNKIRDYQAKKKELQAEINGLDEKIKDTLEKVRDIKSKKK